MDLPTIFLGSILNPCKMHFVTISSTVEFYDLQSVDDTPLEIHEGYSRPIKRNNQSNPTQGNVKTVDGPV